MYLLEGYSSESESDCEEDKLPQQVDSSAINRKLFDKYHIKPTTGPKRNTPDHLMKTRFWTSFVYIDWRLTSKERRLLSGYLAQCNNQYKKYGIEFKPLFYSDLGTPLNLHVSLSPNLKFGDRDERDQFFNILQNNLALKVSKSFTIPLERHPKLLKAPGSLTTFLTLPIDPNILTKYIKPLFNEIAILWNSRHNLTMSLQPELSLDESFINKAHVSIAKTWSPIPQSDEMTLLLPPLDNTLMIPENHRIQYDRDRESLTLNIPFS